VANPFLPQAKKSVLIRVIRGNLFAAGKKNPAPAGLKISLCGYA